MGNGVAHATVSHHGRMGREPAHAETANMTCKSIDVFLLNLLAKPVHYR